MYYTLYIDVFFLENLLLDYLLLTLLGRLLKAPAGRLRRLLAAAMGSAFLSMLYVLSLQDTLAGKLFLYVILSLGMLRTGLKLRGAWMLGKAMILLYLSSFLLGGIFQWVSRNFHFPLYPFLGLTLASYWLLSLGMSWLLRFQKQEVSMLMVELGFRGRSIRLKGLVDTGNQLRDPVFGKPVSILTRKAKEELCRDAEVLLYPVPFHSIGRKDGLLPSFYADYMAIETTSGETLRIERPLLGITKEPLSSKKEYDMILHPALLSQDAEQQKNQEENKVC